MKEQVASSNKPCLNSKQTKELLEGRRGCINNGENVKVNKDGLIVKRYRL